MALFSDAFSEVVQEYREAKKMSRAALAAKAGLHQTYIGMLEMGLRSPSVDTAKAVADALDIPFSALVALAEERLLKIEPEGMTPEWRRKELEKPGVDGFDTRKKKE